MEPFSAPADPDRAPLARIGGNASARRHFRYADFVMAAFVTILLLSNLIGAAKQGVVTLPILGQWTYGAGVLFFPVSYILGDVLTEVYGYAHARRCIWAGLVALLFLVFMSAVVVAIPLPPAGRWPRATMSCSAGTSPRLTRRHMKQCSARRRASFSPRSPPSGRASSSTASSSRG